MGATSSQCHNCGSLLASDQRYCLVCGERRGRARFLLPGPATTAPAPAPAPVPIARPGRVASGVAFVAFVGTLLLAMAVGVLIGHNNSNATPQRVASTPVQIVKIDGGGGGGASTSAAAAPANAGTHTAKAKPKTVTVTKKVAAKAAAAAAKVLGSSAKNLPPPTVTVGQSGHGPGYQGGHFTGNFFGQ